MHLQKPWRQVSSSFHYLFDELTHLVLFNPGQILNLFSNWIIPSTWVQLSQKNIINLILSKGRSLWPFLSIKNFLHEVKLLVRDNHLKFPSQSSVQRMSNRFFSSFLVVKHLDHVGMRTAGIGPALRKSFLLNGPLLHQELILLIKQENAKSSMRQ